MPTDWMIEDPATGELVPAPAHDLAMLAHADQILDDIEAGTHDFSDYGDPVEFAAMFKLRRDL
jgi:hypothetical protein